MAGRGWWGQQFEELLRLKNFCHGKPEQREHGGEHMVAGERDVWNQDSPEEPLLEMVGSVGVGS